MRSRSRSLRGAAAAGHRQFSDRGRRLVRDREAGTDIDLAKDVAVGPHRIARPVKKIRVPDDRQRRRIEAEYVDHLRHPFGFHFRAQGLKRCGIGAVHDARPGLRRGRIRPFGRRLDQGFYVLVPEAGDAVRAHIAADHTVRQARLKRLIDDAAAPAEIGLATAYEALERQLFGDTAALRMQHAYKRVSAAPAVDKLHFPHALAAVAAVLLQHPRAGLQSHWERVTKFRRATIEMRVRAPAEMLGAVENLLDAHFENDVGMRAGPRPARRDVTQQRVERLARLALVDRIDPDEHAIGAKQLLAHLIREVLVIDGRLGTDADRGELFEDAVEAVVRRRRGLPRFEIATPKNCDFKVFLIGHYWFLEEEL